MKIKHTLIVSFLMMILTINAMGADSDFAFDAAGSGFREHPGSITNYTGWDTDITIPAEIAGQPVKAIGTGAFKGAGIVSVTIPAGVEILGKDAFRDNQLTKVVIPGTVKIIEKGAFANNQLIEVVISQGVTVIGPRNTSGLNTGTFENNRITKVVIPDGVVAIGEDTFKGNKLESITLPASIRDLGDNQFNTGKGIGGNPDIAILPDYIGGTPHSLRESVGASIFNNYIANNMQAGTYSRDMRCDERAEGNFTYSITQHGIVLHTWNGKENRLRIPSEFGGIPVKAIGYGYISDGYRRVFTSIFDNKYLDNVLIPEGITFIGENVFRLNKLTQLVLPSTITYIGEGAFSAGNYSNINQFDIVTLPKALKYLGDAFSWRDGFTFIIGSDVETADDDDFGKFYRQNGKKGGRYIYNDRMWSYREE